MRKSTTEVLISRHHRTHPNQVSKTRRMSLLAGTQSFAGVEKVLLETNKLLKGTLDKSEKQIRSFKLVSYH